MEWHCRLEHLGLLHRDELQSVKGGFAVPGIGDEAPHA